ncbi:tetratricopeptide repeat protein [Acinetobacter sp. ANC 4636]
MTTTISAESISQLQRWLSFLEQDPKNIHLISSILKLALETNQIEILSRMIVHLQTQDIDEPQLNRLASLICLQLGRFPEAVIFGENVLGTEFENTIVLYNLAYAHLYMTEYEKAYATLQPLINSSTVLEEDTYVLYARVLHHLEQPAQAMSSLKKAISLNPLHAEALGNLALLQYETNHNFSDYLNVKETAEKALKINPYQLEALLALGEVQLNERSIISARNTFNLILEHYPQSGRAWSGLGQLEFYEMNLEKAELHLLQAIEYMNNHVGTWHILAWCYVLKQNIEKAAWAFETSLPLNTEFADTYGGLAVVEAMKHNFIKANQLIQQAFDIDEHSMAAQYAEYILLSNARQTTAAQQKMNDILIRRAPSSENSGQVLVHEWLSNHPDFQKHLNEEERP